MTKEEAKNVVIFIAQTAVAQINILAEESEFDAKGLLRTVMKVLEIALKDD